MKKLMIAAAAAAMIGGAYAVTAEYNFVAYLTTTTGAQGKDAYEAFAGNVGTDKEGTLWYDDATLKGLVRTTDNVNYQWRTPANYPNLTWTTKETLGGVTIPTLTIAKNADGIPLVNKEYEAPLLKRLTETYIYKNNGLYCASFAWWTVTPAQCFRVQGADNIYTTITLDGAVNCCDRTTGNNDGWDRAFMNGQNKVVDFGDTELGAGTWTVSLSSSDYRYSNPYRGLLNCFGAQAYANALYIETYARVKNVSTLNAKLPFDGWLAGQGYAFETLGARLPYQITGTIVGKTTAPKCIDCCSRPEDRPSAIAFECLDSNVADGTLNTAAFGTYYIQYNGNHN